MEVRGRLHTEESDTQRVRHSDSTTTTNSNIKTRERPCETTKVWNNTSHKCIYIYKLYMHLYILYIMTLVSHDQVKFISDMQF